MKLLVWTDEVPSDSGNAIAQQTYAYQRKVGALLYATTISRPDAARTANKLSEFLVNLGPQHMEAVNHALGYLYNTRFLAILFSENTDPQQIFTCASDAEFGDDTTTRYSTEGYILEFFGGAIGWRSTKQRTVTLRLETSL